MADDSGDETETGKMDLQQASLRIKEEAYRLGFGACGIAPVGTADTEASYFDRWLTAGYQAGMEYMNRYRTLRFDPTGLVEGARSVICVALNYYPAIRQAPSALRIAYYAYGRDYHEVVKEKLRALLRFISDEPDEPGVSARADESASATAPESRKPVRARVFTDSAPVLERYWAWKAGLGWIGKNTNLIIPGKGSYFFLGEIVIDREYAYDTPVENRCGRCSRCLDACPTGALETARCLNANKCLSYLTIEHRGPIPPAQAARLGNRLYGCDTCQSVCPWNRFAVPTEVPDFRLPRELVHLTREEAAGWSEEAYKRIFRHSAVKRAGYAGLTRTLSQLSGNGCLSGEDKKCEATVEKETLKPFRKERAEPVEKEAMKPVEKNDAEPVEKEATEIPAVKANTNIKEDTEPFKKEDAGTLQKEGVRAAEK